MIINHNMNAINAHRLMSGNTANAGKSMEKLSSGLRINRAGDDAAGLAISEKMRAQIRGLDQASRNSQDGISMIQTAEGALNETQNILQRMRELATQSANDTNVGVDRGEIQKEINQLTSEINRIGNTTEFNTQNLLNGGGKDVTNVKTGGGVTVPSSLSNGEGAAIANLQKTFTVATAFDNTESTGDDGKKISFTFGERTVELELNRNLDAASSTATQIGIKDVATTADSATAIHAALTKAFAEDTYLSDNFSLNAVAGSGFRIDADALAYNNGKLTGIESGSEGNMTILTDTSLNITEAVTQASAGRQATSVLDFTGKDISDVKGTGFSITNASGQVFNINLYDGADGKYKGTEDATNIAVNINGAGNAEAIVDKIVAALADSDGTTKIAMGGADVAYATKTESSKLLITAATGVVGQSGNLIKVDNNSDLAVSNVVGSEKLTGEEVVSAKGLTDGQHTVKVTYNAASSLAGVDSTTTAALTVSVGTTTNFESGTYRLTNNDVGADHAQLQKLGADGTTWSTVSGYEDITMAASTTIGDITIGSYTAGDITDDVAETEVFEFTINKQGYTAAIKEAGSTEYGNEIAISSGDTNINLAAKDGVGEVTVNIGEISDTLSIGANATFNFSTSASGVKNENVGGTFTAKFQIGANQGQSFQMDIKDMRSQALSISGTSAGASQGTVDGAKFIATKDVTNGTTSTGTEYALDVSSHETATAAIKVINNAIESVSAQRSSLGAYQNRLEHTIANLGTSSENLTSAESRIRDVDMAKEMMTFSKNNILSQAAQAMLAQANQQPQGVLQLLR